MILLSTASRAKGLEVPMPTFCAATGTLLSSNDVQKSGSFFIIDGVLPIKVAKGPAESKLLRQRSVFFLQKAQHSYPPTSP
jgi:hypothetical protein